MPDPNEVAEAKTDVVQEPAVEEKPAESTPADAPTAEARAADEAPAMEKPAEEKPTEEKPVEAVVEERPAEAAAEDEPAEVATEAKHAEDKPVEATTEEKPAEAAVQEKPVEAAEEKPTEIVPEKPKAPAPSIASIEPVAVSVRGGAVIEVDGADFVDGCKAKIDGELAPYVWISASRLEVIAPDHAAGTADLAIENPDGQVVVQERALTYAVAPVLTQVMPGIGSVRGGAEVTLSGRGFEEGVVVKLAGGAVPEVTYDGPTLLRFTAPPYVELRAVDVSVVNPSGLSHTLEGAFVYRAHPPRISAVEPAVGPNAGGTKLTIRGECFAEGCEVFVCGLPVATAFKSAEALEVTTPAVSRDGLVDVRVLNRDDQAHVAERVFRYVAPLPPPVLTTVSPDKGPKAGGTKVTLIGEDLHEDVAVRFGGVVAQVKFLTHKQIEAEAPAFATAGAVTVEVVNPDGVSAAIESAFTYEGKPPPTITSVSPAFGPTTGGTKLVIEGTNFTKESVVYIGREYPKDLLLKSATELHAVTAPRKAAGVVDVEVAGPDVVKAVAKNAFRYDATPAPVITSVSPNAGAVGGGTELTISGKNFLKETQVLVDGRPVKTVKLVDKSTLELKTPGGEAGKMVDVTVRNPDGKEAVQKRAFLYDPRYRG